MEIGGYTRPAWSISMTPMTPIPRQYYSECYMRALALSYNE